VERSGCGIIVICQKRLRETTEDLSHDNLCPDEDSNRTPLNTSQKGYSLSRVPQYFTK
jgi:hypothetical protein